MAIGRVITPMGGGGVDISDADAVVADVLVDKTFYAVSGGKKTGTMPDRGTVNTDITTKAQEVAIAAGKHSGSGIVKISSAEQAKIIAENIKDGVTILGQAGSLSAGGGGSIIVREYIAGATWNKPTGLIALWVVCVGAGGGGGSGRRGSTGTNRGGASGGGGGVLNIGFFRASEVSSSVSVTVGAGGAGGAVRTTDNTNGVNGSAGGDSSFGTLVLAKSGRHGIGGSANAAGVPGALQVYDGKPLMGINGSGGGQGNTSAKGSNVLGCFLYWGASGGAGGGCISSSNVTYEGGDVSNGKDTIGNTFATRVGGGVGVNGSDGSDDMCLQVLPMLDASVYLSKGIGNGGGSGGGSGDVAGTIAAGRGGHGGRCCGGGGGGGSTNGTNSGAGGNGGGGLVILVEIY